MSDRLSRHRHQPVRPSFWSPQTTDYILRTRYAPPLCNLNLSIDRRGLLTEKHCVIAGHHGPGPNLAIRPHGTNAGSTLQYGSTWHLTLPWSADQSTHPRRGPPPAVGEQS